MPPIAYHFCRRTRVGAQPFCRNRAGYRLGRQPRGWTLIRATGPDALYCRYHAQVECDTLNALLAAQEERKEETPMPYYRVCVEIQRFDTATQDYATIYEECEGLLSRDRLNATVRGIADALEAHTLSPALPVDEETLNLPMAETNSIPS